MSRIALCVSLCSALLLVCDADRVSAQAKDDKQAEEAAPETVSWSYLDAGYAFTKFGNDTNTTFGDLSSLDDAHGLGLALSYGFKKYFHITADYTWGEDDKDNVDLTKVFMGAGAHYSILKSVDVYGDLGYAIWELGDDGPVDDKDRNDGVSVRGGIRGFVMPAAELGFRAAYADLNGHSTGTGRLSAHYYLTPMIAFGINVDYDTDEMLTIYSGFRLDFLRS
jgi:hypothetical protein